MRLSYHRRETHQVDLEEVQAPYKTAQRALCRLNPL